MATYAANGDANAAAAFQSASSGAGIDVHTLGALAQVQLAVANLLGQAGSQVVPGNLSVTGTLAVGALASLNLGATVTGANLIVSGFNITPAGDNSGQVGTALLRFAEAHIATGSFNALTLIGFGAGTGVVSTGAADSGGTGFRLLLVPN